MVTSKTLLIFNFNSIYSHNEFVGMAKFGLVGKGLAGKFGRLDHFRIGNRFVLWNHNVGINY